MKIIKRNFLIGQLKPIVHLTLLGVMSVSLSACNTLIGGSGFPSGPAGGPSLPAPPVGGGSGGAGEPSPPSLPSKPSSGSSNDSEANKQKEGESPDSESGKSQNSDAPEGWEDESAGSEPIDNEKGPSFEEPKDDDEFKVPGFEDKGGLSDEELAELEKELDETLGDFDEEIEREQEYAEARANGAQESDGGDAFEEYDEEADKQAKAKRQSTSGSKKSSDSAGSNSGSESQESGGESGQTASAKKKGTSEQEQDPNVALEDDVDLEDLRKNDDIVARQIREAAENEVDPELKKKLWQEYYNYKQQ